MTTDDARPGSAALAGSPPVRQSLGSAVAQHPPQRPFRGDIEGLRAVAVVLVLLFHAGVGWVPGGFVGVDVFFVISGFLITSLLLAEAAGSGGRIDVVAFYGRRARRLLPAALVVLTATAALTVTLLPRVRWAETGQDVVASAAFVVNWQLAARSVEYLAADRAPSAVQQFWSLAVEEQFYVVWPLLLVAVLAGRARWAPRADVRRSLLLALLLLAVPSLAWSVHLSSADPSRAYFVTTTRVWELALGAAVAVWALRPGRLAPALAAVAAWTGLAALLVTPLLLTSATPFPGSIALVPTLGTAALLATGHVAGRAGPGRLLALPVLRWLGALSYSLYLWHWPLLVVAEARWGLSGGRGLVVGLVALVPAAVTHYVVENPLRRRRAYLVAPARAVRLGLACTAAAVAVGLVLSQAGKGSPQVDGASQALGPRALGTDPSGSPAGRPVDDPGPFVPPAETAREDLPVVYERDCHGDQTVERATACVLGVEQGPVTVAVVGDSHAAQWVPPLEQLAEQRGWRLLSFTKSNCPLTAATLVDRTGAPYRSCEAWNDDVVQSLLDVRPDLVVVTSYLRYEAAPGTSLVEGLREAWAALLAAGLPVLAIEDTPAPGIDVADCVSGHPGRLSACAVPRELALGDRSTGQAAAAAGVPGVQVVDLNAAVCPTDLCAPVIGGVLVYRDQNHMTATYARLLAERLGPALDEALEP